MKLINPYSETGTVKVDCRIDDATYNYLFRGVFAGARTGIRAALIGQFFKALHAECLAQNIKPVFDPENESRIAGILARLNFTDVAALAGGSSASPDPRTPINQNKPRAGRRNGTGRPTKVRASGAQASTVTSDAISQP